MARPLPMADPLPHGGTLVQLVVDPSRAEALRRDTALPCWHLTPRQVCDLELLLNGAFSPLDGFLGKADFERVCREMRLADGTLWPMPINLDITQEFVAKEQIKTGSRIALRHPEGMVLAVITVGDVWTPDRKWEAEAVFGTTDDTHPGVFALINQTNPVYVGGKVEGVEAPPHHTFQGLRFSPPEMRAEFKKRGWDKVVAFQTRNPMHRAHVELTKRAAAKVGANLLIHPVVGRTKPGDLDYFVRVRCYQAVLKHYPEQTTMLSLLPLAMRMGGPREAVWHALIRKNFGCTHMIVGRDHAGPGSDGSGRPFYGPYEAQEMALKLQDELGIEIVPFQELRYVPERDGFFAADEVPSGVATATLSGTELRGRLRRGLELPPWFTFPEVAAELRKLHPPRKERGLTIFFTGLSGSGKSTVANALVAKLLEQGGRSVTLLDGDVVRRQLSSELGFGREDRDTHVLRVAFVAREVVRHGGIAVCALIAPYDGTRRRARACVEEAGAFVLVHVRTPIEVCEERDPKGLYARARKGDLPEFTGVSDPYEIPQDAEISIDMSTLTPAEGADCVIEGLVGRGYVSGGA